jgi:hypothetical protein
MMLKVGEFAGVVGDGVTKLYDASGSYVVGTMSPVGTSQIKLTVLEGRYEGMTFVKYVGEQIRGIVAMLLPNALIAA